MQLLYRPIKWSLDTESDFMESVVGNSKNLFDTKTLKQHKMQVQYSKQILNSATIFKLSLTLKFCLAFDSKLTDILKNHIAS